MLLWLSVCAYTYIKLCVCVCVQHVCTRWTGMYPAARSMHVSVYAWHQRHTVNVCENIQWKCVKTYSERVRKHTVNVCENIQWKCAKTYSERVWKHTVNVYVCHYKTTVSMYERSCSTLQNYIHIENLHAYTYVVIRRIVNTWKCISEMVEILKVFDE